MSQPVPPDGILLIDKPTSWTSHDVVARVRRLAGTRKVGHAGTLDPMATGLLVLGLGTATRLLTYLVGADKQYEAVIRLGATTTTDDADGETVQTASPHALDAVDRQRVQRAIDALTGDIMQVPSSVSAIKVDGKRAYARVRGGEEVRLPARPVTVSAFRLLSFEPFPAGIDLRVRVDCSSGTYIRALARDLGAALDVGGHLVALRRTRVGPFTIDDAAPLDSLQVTQRLLSPAEAASRVFPRLELTAQQSTDLGHGKRLPVDGLALPDGHDLGPLAAVAPDGRLIGLVEMRGDAARVLVNFPTPGGAAPNGADS